MAKFEQGRVELEQLEGGFIYFVDRSGFKATILHPLDYVSDMQLMGYVNLEVGDAVTFFDIIGRSNLFRPGREIIERNHSIAKKDLLVINPLAVKKGNG